MSLDPAHAIAEAISEAQAMLHDHLESGVGAPADVLARVNKVLSDRRLMRALSHAGVFPRENPPDAIFTLLDLQTRGNQWP